LGRAQDEVLRHFSFLTVAEELQTAAVSLVDSLYDDVERLHGNDLRVLRSAKARVYRKEIKALRRELAAYGEELAALGVQAKKNNIEIRTVRGELMPAGLHGKELGFVSAEVVRGRLVVYVTEGFWRASRNPRAPPALFALLARHELRELTAFRVPDSAPYEDFKRYRAQNDAAKDFASFHRYLVEAEPQQKALIDFAGETVSGRMASLLEAEGRETLAAVRPQAPSGSSVIDRDRLGAMIARFFSGTRYTAPDILLGRPFSRKAVEAFRKVVSDLRKAVPEEVLSLIDPKYFHITVVAEGYRQTGSLSSPEFMEDARKRMAGRLAAGASAFTGSLSGKLKLMPDGVIILEITDPGMTEGVRRIRSLFKGDEWYLPKIVHVTVGRLRTLEYAPGDIRKIEEVLEAHNRAGTMNVLLSVDSVRFGQFTEQGQEEFYASSLSLAGATVRPGVKGIIKEVLRKINPFNPSGIHTGAAQAPAAPALFPELEGRQVVEVSLSPDTEKLAALGERGARAFAVSVTEKRRGAHIGNIIVPAVAGEGRTIKNANVEVYLESLPTAGGRQVPVLNLFRPGPSVTEGARQLDLLLLLGRGALAVVNELHENPVMRKKAQGLAGHVFEDAAPAVIEMQGPVAALARPEVFLDENSRNALFRDTEFVYDAGTGAAALLAADEPLSGKLDTGSFLVRDALKDGELDLTRLGMMAADVVTGDREALAAFPWLKGLMHVKVPFGRGGTALAEYLGAVYRDPLRRKTAESVTEARTNLSITLPVSALRKNVNDPGVGKFTDLAPYFNNELKPMGVGTILLTGVLKTAGESFNATVSAMALSEDSIDWAKEFLRLGLDPSRSAAPENETEWVHLDELREREFTLSAEAYRAFAGKTGARARAFEEFVGANASWLDGYAEFMSLARSLPGKAPGEWSAGDIAQARADTLFKEYADLYRYRQWLAHGQLQEALAAIREQGGKVLFDYPLFRSRDSAERFIHPEYFIDRSPATGDVKRDGPVLWNWTRLGQDDYRPVLDPVRYWLSRGFDGLRFGALPFAYGQKDGRNEASRSGDEPGDAFVMRLRAAVDAANPKAIVVAEAPEGMAGHLRDSYGLMTIEELGGLLPGARVKEGTWLQIDAYNADLRPQDDERYKTRFGMQNDEDSFMRLFENLFRSGADFVSFTVGTQWGDTQPARRHYRVPREGDDTRRRFDMARRINKLAALVRPATRAAFFEQGYRAAFGYREFPRLDEEGWASLGKMKKLDLRSAGDTVESFEAPGLHCLLSAYEQALSGRGKGAAVFEQNSGGVFFEAVYDVLARTPGLGPDAWPDGWSYVRSLEKDVRVRQSREEQALCNAQLAGFVRGVMERALEARYVAFGGVLQGDAEDRESFRALLLAADSRNVAPAPGEEKELPALTLSRAVAPLAGIIGAGGKTIPLEVRQRMLEEASGKAPDLVDAAVRARAAIEVREQQGWSLAQIESEVRGILDPVLAKLALSGTVPRELALEPARAAEEQWALSELLRILSLFADRPLLSGPEALEQPAATAVETIRQMLGAA
ncbi:MAG: 4-alpha-glucanotransferase, partial [Endomicrobiales bacterium]